MSEVVPGHVYVIAGDLTRLVCDAWLLPTDRAFQISGAFAAAVGVRSNTLLEGYDWGDGRVLRFAETERPQVWLGDVGAFGKEAQWYADIVEPFVAGAVAGLHVPQGQRPLLALPVVGTGEGGMFDSKGDIHKALFRSLYAAAATYWVDLVLVCWGRRAYSAAQRIRRRFVNEKQGGRAGALWDLGPRDETLSDRAKALADHARRGTLVLFMGAGVSTGAGVPAWRDLLDDIARGLGADAPPLDRLHRFDLRDQARLLGARIKPPATLETEVFARMGRTRYSLVHALLASLNVREAVTTNYDRLYEDAVEAASGPAKTSLAVLPYQPVEPRRGWLLKLHGSIEHQESVVITRDDYLSVPTRHGALFGIVQALLLTRHMLFVGYSLSDEDFHQLVYEVRLARQGTSGPERFGTVLGAFEDLLLHELWEDDLDVVALCDELNNDPIDRDWYAQTSQLQKVLDLVGFLAADLDAFILDPTYEGLLDPQEQRLAQLLHPLLELNTSEIDATAPPVATRLRQLLREIGASPDGAN